MSTKDGLSRRFSTPREGSLLRAALAGVSLLSLLGSSIGLAQANPLQEAAATSRDTDTGEIVVTAQRRTQSLQSIPYNISAVSGADIAKSGIVSINSLTQAVTGLTTIDSGPATRGGTNNFSLRGLRTDNPSGFDFAQQNVSPVSTYLGDVPVFFPLVLKDIERIEVLRGPQGTLYGSGAQAGTIRFIPNRPSFDKFSAELTAGGGLSEHSGRSNSNVGAVINLPLTDKLALRVVAGIDHLGGFIDQSNLIARQGSGLGALPVSANPASLTSAPTLGPVEKDTNYSNQYYVRSSLRYEPVDGVDLQLDYTHQFTKTGDIQASNARYPGGPVDLGEALGASDSVYVKRSGGKYTGTMPIKQPYENKVDVVSGTATFDLGFASFTSVSSYYENHTVSVGEESMFYGDVEDGIGGLVSYYASYPRFIAPMINEVNEKAFTQEVRLVSTPGGPIDYVIGGYFQRQTRNDQQQQFSPGIAAFAAANGTPGASPEVGDLIYEVGHRTKFIDRAIFGEVTWHVTDKLNITGGTRFFWQDFTTSYRGSSPFCGAACGDGTSEPANLGLITSTNKSPVNDHIFKANVAYDVTPDLKFYSTYSEGFRRGGANSFPLAGYARSLPLFTAYKPDLAKNYEVGAKGRLFDRSFSFSADLYQIDLQDFQFSSSSPSYIGGVYNGDLARSKGVELEMSKRFGRNLSINVGYAYTDAKVVKGSDFVDYPLYSILSGAQPYVFLSLKKGDRLPGVPRHTINAGADYSLAGLDLHADVAYRSGALGAIDPNNRNFWKMPGYAVVNTRASFDFTSAVRASIYVTNLTNAAGYSGGVGPQEFPSSWTGRTIMRPRTYGLDLTYKFQ
jgi:outer membrane receptor protein involved in Fe transport